MLLETITLEQYNEQIKKLFTQYKNYGNDVAHICDLIGIDTDLIFINLLEKRE